MKKATPFSYKNNPVIHAIETKSILDGGLGVISKDDFDDKKDDIINVWTKLSDSFGQNIQYISSPFYEAFKLAQEKLLLLPDLAERISGSSGTLIIGKYTFCYNINFATISAQSLQCFFVFNSNALVAFYHYDLSEVRNFSREEIVEHLNRHIPFNMFEKWWFCKSVKNQFVKDDETCRGYYLGKIWLLLNFIKYATVETKHLPYGQKVKFVDCKYRNDTKSNITILNSTWFTNLVKSDAFKVRGHFRLQACGEGLKERKLIWINEFQKEGYTAPARKLSQAV